MANKKKKKKSNSYWMKYGGVGPTKMDRFKGYIEKKHKGGFTHPHPHPKEATESQLKGAQIWGSYTSDGKPLKKRTNYNWSDKESADVKAFMDSKWFNFFPDTASNVPKTIEELNKYEDAIGANRTRTIQLHDTDFSWDDIVGYGGPAAAWFGASNVANSVPTPWSQAAGLTMKLLGGLGFGGKLLYDNWYKKGENEQLKKDNPYATFVDGDGNILNYEDGNGLFFDLFHPSKENSITYNKDIRDPAIPLEETENKEKVVTFAMGGNPYKKMYEGGGNPNSQTDIIEDPTFKMWFSKNARRSDVMQSSSDPQALKQLFLSDINFPGNEMPLFSGEIDGFGNIDKSNRTPELSSRMIGGMNKMYGGMGHSYKKPRAKAELGMGTGLYESPTDYVRDYSNVNKTGPGGRNDNNMNTIGRAGEDGTIQNRILKSFNYVIPGLGTGLDLVADIFGHFGKKKQHKENIKDANESVNTMRTLNVDGVNKDTLDLSTRMGGLNAISSYLGTEAPKFDWGNAAKSAISVAGNYVDIPGVDDVLKNIKPGSGDTPIPYEDIGLDDIAPNPAGSAMYGGDMDKYGKGGRPGLWANMHAKRARGESPAKPGEKGYPKTLNIKQMGGALNFQPGSAQDLIGANFNPLGEMQTFESQGTAGNSFNDGGHAGDPNMTEYEAEGGETIMHQPGDVPVTTADTTQIDGNPNEAMLSMLEGNSHDSGGEIVQSSEGQYVFSKSLTSKTWGMNFADASEKIGQHIAKFKKEAEDGDEITKSTAMSMIEAWNQKLTDLQTEQESERQKKYMDLLNSGATEEALYEKFPDIHQQFMQQQQEQALSEQAMASIAGPMGGMQDNPMGNIDMSQLSAQDQELVGAKYGLPQAETGFDPMDFNRFFGQTFGNNDFESFSLNKNYEPSKRDLMGYLTANYPDGGFKIGDETYTNNKDAYKALMSGFSDWRGTQLKNIDVPGSKPKANDYKEVQLIPNEFFQSTELTPDEPEFDEVFDWTDDGRAEFSKDKGLFNLYNSGLGVDWDENFGMDAGMSKRKYFKALEQRLLSEGKSAEDVASIMDRERIKYDENLDALEAKEKNKPLSPDEEAELLAKKMRNKELGKKGLEFLGNTFKDLTTLGPTMYNFNKANEGVENEPFVANENEALIKENLKRLSNSLDITNLLEENEQNFNSLKYLARDVGDGSSGSAMNLLLRGQNNQNQADLKAYLTEAQLEQQGLQIGNESLFNMGERDRQEEVRVNEANAMNRAAQEAFKAKGWEGLSGFGQLKEQMSNQMAQDENLKGMLNMIYPDAHLYLNRDGSMDISKLAESGELDKLIKQYPQLKEYMESYLNKNK